MKQRETRKSNSCRPARRGERGSSLFGAVLAAGVLAAFVYTVMELQKKGNATEKTLLGQSDALFVTGNMAVLLSDGAACLKTFGGLDPSVDGVKVTQMKDYTGNPQFSVGTVYGNRTIQLTGIALGGTGVDSQSRLNRWSSTVPGTGLALVRVDWLQVGSASGMSLGPAHLYRTFLVDAKVDIATKKITACNALTGPLTQSQSGTGTTNRIPLWVNSATLGDSVMAEGDRKIGVGTTTPASTFSVAGSMAVGAYAGVSAAPLNGLIVSGRIGVGTATPSAPLELKGELRFTGGSGYVGLRAPASGTGAVAWTLPANNGLPGQLLMTNGMGVLSWSYCAPPPGGCTAQVIDACQLTNTAAGGSSGTCAAGYTGACTYNCAVDTTGIAKWQVVNNTCKKSCPDQTITTCVLPASPHGTTAGSCAPGYTGSCSYLCTDGTWGPPTANTCVCPSGSASFTTPGFSSFNVPLCYNSLKVEAWGGGGGGQSAGVWMGWPIVIGGGSGGKSSFGGILTAFGGAGVLGGGATGGTTNLSGENGNWNGWNCPGLGGGSPFGGGRSGGVPGGGGDGFCFGWGANGGGGGGYSTTTFSPGALTPGAPIPIEVGGGGSDRGARGEVRINWN